MNDNQELKEKLAANEHERWADWQKWMHSKMTDHIVDGKAMFCLDVADIVRWQKQIVTPYSRLSEGEKQSDRDQVDRYWPLVQAYCDRKCRESRINELEKLLVRWVDNEVLVDRLAELQEEEK
jgi:hypothetical protein